MTRNTYERRFLILGRPNAGKTLLMLNFSEYMGYSNLAISLKYQDNEVTKKSDIDNLKRTFVSEAPNTTRCVQSILIDIPVLKSKKQVEFIDSTGLSSSVHFDQEVREGMVQTLSLLKQKNIMLHMIDADCVSKEKKIDDIDRELYKFGIKRGNYLVLANKMDLEGASDGLDIIEDNFSKAKIIKISALSKTGFNEVKRYVSKLT